MEKIVVQRINEKRELENVELPIQDVRPIKRIERDGEGYFVCLVAGDENGRYVIPEHINGVENPSVTALKQEAARIKKEREAKEKGVIVPYNTVASATVYDPEVAARNAATLNTVEEPKKGSAAKKAALAALGLAGVVAVTALVTDSCAKKKYSPADAKTDITVDTPTPTPDAGIAEMPEEKELVVITQDILTERAALLGEELKGLEVFDTVDNQGNPIYRPLYDNELEAYTFMVNYDHIAKTNIDLFNEKVGSEENYVKFYQDAFTVADLIRNAEITEADDTRDWSVAVVDEDLREKASALVQDVVALKDLAATVPAGTAYDSEDGQELSMAMQMNVLNVYHALLNHEDGNYGLNWAMNNYFAGIMGGDNVLKNYLNTDQYLAWVTYDEEGKEVSSISYLENLAVHTSSEANATLVFKDVAYDKELNPGRKNDVTQVSEKLYENQANYTGIVTLRRDCLKTNQVSEVSEVKTLSM